MVDIMEFKALYEWFLLRACFASLTALIVTVVCLKAYEHIPRLKEATKRYGWPLVILFIAYSAWATYTAFPTFEEKNRSEGVGETNHIDFVEGSVNIDNVQILPLANSNTVLGNGEQGTGNGEWEEGTGKWNEELQNSIGNIQQDNTTTPTALTQNDFDRGFVLSRIGTNEVYDFSPPEGAVVCRDWLSFGSLSDWEYLSPDDWIFPFGTNIVKRLRVFSDGEATSIPSTTNTYFAPLKTLLGIVPQANWHLLNETNRPSCFWHYFTPQESLILTWQNALYGRETNAPASFQMELFSNGNFTYRYDLSRTGIWDGQALTNILIGASCEGLAKTIDITTLTNLTSLTFYRLDSSDSPQSDLDGDGLLLEDELFVYHTDPNFKDSDYDGLSDYEETNVYETNPLDAHSSGGSYYDGIAVKLEGLNPFDYPTGSTNTVLEHLFYSGSVDGAFSYSESSDAKAVLKINVSGTGSGRLIIGDVVVPVIAPLNGQQLFSRNFSGSNLYSLFVGLVKGVTYKMFFLGDKTLNLTFSSENFAFGNLPDIPGGKYNGSINFPDTVATVPCIHDFNAREAFVYLPANNDAKLLVATWSASGGVKVENMPPRSVLITGNVSPDLDTFITYEISHPDYLFGASVFTQKLRFCPHPPEAPSEEESPWYTEGEGDNSTENRYRRIHWYCYWVGCPCWLSFADCGCEWGSCLTGGCDCSYEEDSEDAEEENFDEECPEHKMPYNECSESHEEEYTNAVESVEHLGGVLYIREPPIYEKIQLEVPTEHRNCCPCPEHWTNYVSVAYKSYRLHLVDEDGKAFGSTDKSCTVNLTGVYPSLKIGDASLVFARNGEIYKQYNKTVLGVGIKSGNEELDLNLYNTLDRNFGCPMTVCTNLEEAIEMKLVTNVKLSSGKIHLELADTEGKFAVWYFDLTIWDYRKLLDSEMMPVKDISFSYWRKIMKRSINGESAELPIFVTSSEAGRTKIVFRYWDVVDGKFIEDTADQCVSSVPPPLRADLTRDGRIDGDDIKSFIDGRIFRYWTNEDTVKGDFVGENDDDDPNVNDLIVNGRYDLVNFFPVALDFQRFRNAWGDEVKYIVRTDWNVEPSFNFCFADLPWSDVGSIQTANVTTMSGSYLKDAQLTPLTYGGIELPHDLLSQFSKDSGVMICEAKTIYAQLIVDIMFGDKLLYSYELPMNINSVRDMYRWMNLRYIVGDNGGELSQLHNPWNRPDEECDGKHFVFVHGYNVNAVDARVWADQMFKRLWWAGSKSMFTAVDWRGDESQIYVPTQGDVSPYYYINVRHAFMTAEHAATNINALSGEKIMLAHSLGNMLVSSAAKDHGLNYSKYYMLNAAVPIEAYNEDAYSSLMSDGAWSDIPESMRASRYSDLFSHTTNDFRLGLSWKGRFAGIQNAVNCFSPTEDVLKNPKVNKIFGMSVGEDFGGAWSKQELFKGCALWYGVNSITFAGAEIEGGWGINARYMANPLAYIPLSGFNPSYFSEYTREGCNEIFMQHQ